MKTSIHSSVKKIILKEVFEACTASTCYRKCIRYSDETFLDAGIGRVLATAKSGRDWVQQLVMKFALELSVGNFFAAMKSKRRLNLLEDVDRKIRKKHDAEVSQKGDVLSPHPELKNFAIYASDGHTHKASAHEKAIEGKVRPVTHIYTLNLRSSSLGHIDLCVPEAGKKLEHELKTLKRQNGRDLRMGEPKGIKTLHLYDPAVIDYAQWDQWKKGFGVYIITREKSNSVLLAEKSLDWDKEDPRNKGVQADEALLNGAGIRMRRVTYEDPVRGKTYRFITNEMTLPPGIIAFLYKKRWDIEKIFDELKKKLEEKKAWGQSMEAKKQQAHFICLTHNLMQILKEKLEKEEEIIDRTNESKRRKRIAEEKSQAEKRGKEPNILVSGCERMSQKSHQFIRWLRHVYWEESTWGESIALLRPLMQKYIS